jgi:diguanylate cyclase (GGDEF)-like protein
LGKLLQTHTRRGDVACRYGGEEFVVILPGADLETARGRAEALRAAFAEMRSEYEGKILQGTLSLGVAAFPIHGEQAGELVHAADEALYAAKHAGRNRVVANGD